LSERVPAGGPFRAASGMHEALTLEHLNEAKKLVSSYCPGDFCERLVELLSETSRLVAEARLQDLAWEEAYSGVDSNIVAVLRELVEYYANYIAGFYTVHGEYIVVEATAAFEVEDGILLKKGDVVRLPPGKAVRLIIAGLARPLWEASIKLAGVKPGGGQR